MHSGQGLQANLSQAAQRLVDKLKNSKLPQAVCQQIRDDAEQLGMVVARMCPGAEMLEVKLEIMGHYVCSRWHQDNYTCRGIITYNGLGTVYALNDNVDFFELKHCGNNDCIIRDVSQVLSVDAADVFFIKGKLWPNAVNGLVHKSPEKRFHADGAIMNRLCLKVDVP